MVDLLQRDQSVIARHIRNIYKEEELQEEEGTYAKFAHMVHDGLQLYEITHHNLDVIIFRMLFNHLVGILTISLPFSCLFEK